MQDTRNQKKRDWMDAHIEKMNAVGRGKAKLIRIGKRSGVMSCPCGAEGRTLRVALAGRNNHLRAQCSACGFSVME